MEQPSPEPEPVAEPLYLRRCGAECPDGYELEGAFCDPNCDGASECESSPNAASCALLPIDVLQTTPIPFAVTEEAYQYRASAWQESDTSDAPLYSLVSSPAGMTIDASTGVVTWTPRADQSGSHTITIEASVEGRTVTQTYTLDVGTTSIAASAVIGPDGGVLRAPRLGLSVTIAPGDVDTDTEFSLWTLDGATPPIWDEMQELGAAFRIRSDDPNLDEVPVQITYRPRSTPTGANVYLAGLTDGDAGDCGRYHCDWSVDVERMESGSGRSLSSCRWPSETVEN